jgi:hypothetical protein
MSADSGLPAEMRRLLNRLQDDPMVLDDDTADRLLAGRLDPADAPPGYAEAAAVMAAATAPATPDERAGMEPSLDAFRAALGAPPSPPRRSQMLVRLFTVKVAAATFTGALLVGGVAAAATGSLPDAAQRMAHSIVSAAPAPAKGQDIGDAAKAAGSQGSQGASESGDHSQAGSHTTGPDLSKIDKTGLCNAYMAGQGGVNGGKFDAAAFQALERAAGGADKVADFCKDAVTAQGGEQKPADAGSAGDAHGQGQDQKPADAGSAGDTHGGGQP